MNISERIKISIKFILYGNIEDDINKCIWVICDKHGFTRGYKYGFHDVIDCKKCILEEMKKDD